MIEGQLSPAWIAEPVQDVPANFKKERYAHESIFNLNGDLHFGFWAVRLRANDKDAQRQYEGQPAR